MARVRVVTDSTADLPASIRAELGIEMVPLNVHFGEERWKDQVDLAPEAFFEMLARRRDVVPTTSQPAPGAFADVYRRLAEEGCSIVSVHISRTLSATLESARIACDLVPEADVHLLDSRTTTWALGLVVIACARAAAAGMDVEQVLAVGKSARDRTGLFGAIETLEYLQRGGRIGRAQALVGGLLNVKPIISVRDGVVTPVTRVRGQKRVIPELVRLFRDQTEGRPADVAVIYGGDGQAGEPLATALQETGLVRELRSGRIGPVIGCHVGPGVLGFAYTRHGEG